MSNPAEFSETVADVKATTSDVSKARLIIMLVVMGGSTAASWFAFDALGEPGWLGLGTALGVDTALGLWLRVSRRLRKAGVHSTSGAVLEVLAGLMSLALNIGAAVFPVLPKDYHWAALAFVHSFLPILYIALGFAVADAESQLRTLQRKKEAEIERARLAAVEQSQREYDRQRADDKAAKDAADRRLADEQNRKLEAKRLDAEAQEREMADGAAARELEMRKTAVPLAGYLFVAPLLIAARQALRQCSPGRVARSSPAGRQAGSPGVRQAGSPGRATAAPPAKRVVSPQEDDWFDHLLPLARELVRTDPAIGRGKLADALAEKAGHRVTQHMARELKAELGREHDAALAAELEDLTKKVEKNQ